MDPNETLRRWREAAGAEKREFAGHLRDWLRNGGFEPAWKGRERAVFLAESLEKRAARIEREIQKARANPSASDAGLSLLGIAALAAVGFVAYKALSTPAQVAPPAPPAAAVPNPVVTEIDHAAVRDVQDKLRDIGYDPGPTTGQWNPATNNALAAFQRREGLVPADGILNGATGVRLVAVYERKTGQREIAFATRVYNLFAPPAGYSY